MLLVELGMVLRGHLAADENRQMPDLRVNHVEDPLAVQPDFVHVLVINATVTTVEETAIN